MSDQDMSDRVKLEQVLATFGARLDAWPDDARRELEPVLSQDAEARRLLAEATALETVLAAAPVVSAKRHDAIAANILSLARESAQVGAGKGAAVVLLDAHRPARTATTSAVKGTGQGASVPLRNARPAAAAQIGRGWRRAATSSWPAAGVLAASLVLGVWLGVSDVASSFTGDVVVALAGNSEIDDDGAYIPLFDGDAGFEVSL